MELIRIEDIIDFAPMAPHVEPHLYAAPLNYFENMVLPSYISAEAVKDIKALDRESGTDQAKELYEFWHSYVRPLAAYFVFLEILGTHGFTVSSTGLVEFVSGDNTANPISNDKRGILIRQFQKYEGAYKSALKARFEAVNKTFDGQSYKVDGEVYDTDQKPNPGGISAIGRVFERVLNDDVNRNRL